MSDLKTGVLTFHRCINYGSYWQARCLAEGLNAWGHRTSILDHDSRRINLAEWKCAFRPVLPTPVPESDRPLYRRKIEGFFGAFDRLPLSRRFPVNDPSQMEPYDVVVVGSDEVWNLFHPWYGKFPVFYGEGIPAKRLIAYAASFGNYPSSWGLEPVWADRLGNFDSISVRDENSRLIVRNATGIDPAVVLDPCLQFPVKPEERDNLQANQSYVAVYGHNFSEHFTRKVQQFAKGKKLPLISIGYRNDWADEQWITAAPIDFAHFMAGSVAVATNFFHGCVFSLANHRPFVCEASPYRSNKVQGLMIQAGAEQHLVSEDTPNAVVEALLEEPIAETILENICRLRQSSGEFLKRSLIQKQVGIYE